MHNRNKGFTLLELMIVLVIAGIVFTAAVPAFQGMITRNRLATQTNELLVAINLARSEALRVGGTASVQAVNGVDAANEFGPGWCVVLGNPGNCNTPLRVFPALQGSLTMNSIDNVQSLQFNSLGGLANSSNRTFDLCHPTEGGRRVIINLVGRAKSYKPDDPDNPPNC